MVRHTLQAQLYGTQQRLNQMQNDATVALQARADVIGTPTVRQQVVRGVLHLVIEADFTTRAGGDEVIAFIIDRAIQRQAAVPSYVWLKSVDDVALTQTERTASAPGWAVTESTIGIG